MKRRTYQAAICGVEGNYGVVFPDFVGCVSAGDTLGDTRTMAHEALQLHVEGMTEGGEPIPEPGVYTLDEVARMFDDVEEPTGETWVVMIDVEVDVPQAEDVVVIDLPVSLAKDLDLAGVDRRRFVIDAARRELLRLKKTA